ncbi:murein L,D-transpeptidase YafK [Bradyrhizobium sp. AZCC 1578]
MAAYRIWLKRLVLGAGVMAVLSSCAQDAYRSARAAAPIPRATLALMSEKGMEPTSPILMRSFKKESEIEIRKLGSDGRYALLKTYPMCRWSGQLGPKMREGDRQAPEGFYDVTAAAMNPNSSPGNLDVFAHGPTTGYR